ncbi:MAG: heme-binding protein, partial [Anaerolineae bacterium]
LVLAGGVQIIAGGSWVGALGVSGAPGGDLDEACAKAALEKYQERLEFAD